MSSVAKEEWGTKRTCGECGAKFYDMCRAEIVCPKCEAAFVIVPTKSKRAQPAVEKPVAEVKTTEVKGEDSGGGETDAIDELKEVGTGDDEDDDDEDMIEDTSDLGDDEDDVAEVIQKPGTQDES